MRLLHTSDWHVGKAIRGRSRIAEHEAVLAEIAQIAVDRAVDLVVVAGDQFETAAPTAEAEGVVYRALLALAEVAPVVVIAGNHDNARRLLAVGPLLELGRVIVATEIRRPDEGGVRSLDIDGTPVQIALLPFQSQRSIVRADQLMELEGYQQAQEYAARMQKIVRALCAPFSADSVNLVVAHAFVKGGELGGGERSAHLVEEYGIAAADFPATASYVALGHLHRPQRIAGATTMAYAGSPLQLDFGEAAQPKSVNIVEVAPGVPAKVEMVPLTSGRELRTLEGTLADLEGLADTDALGANRDAWLRVRVREQARTGLADEVRELLGEGVVDVSIIGTEHRAAPRRRRRDGRTPRELFGDFLAERDIADPALVLAFDAIHDELGS